MRRTQHKTNNGILTPPPGVSHEEVTPLAVTYIAYADGVLGTASYWHPSAEELARLNEGKPVVLIVLGNVHPPVSLHVDGDTTGVLP